MCADYFSQVFSFPVEIIREEIWGRHGWQRIGAGQGGVPRWRLAGSRTVCGARRAVRARRASESERVTERRGGMLETCGPSVAVAL